MAGDELPVARRASSWKFVLGRCKVKAFGNGFFGMSIVRPVCTVNSTPISTSSFSASSCASFASQRS